MAGNRGKMPRARRGVGANWPERNGIGEQVPRESS